MPRLVIAGAVSMLAVYGVGCGGNGGVSDLAGALSHPNLENVRPARAPVNEVAGSYAGVRLDDPLSQIARRLGPQPPPQRRPDPLHDIGGYPEFLPADTPKSLTYGDVQFTVKGGRVASMLIWGNGARTLRNVGVGSDQAAVRNAYRRIRCSHSYTNGEWVSTPRCEMQLGARRYLYFGGDSVFAVGLSTADFRDPGIGSK